MRRRVALAFATVVAALSASPAARVAWAATPDAERVVLAYHVDGRCPDERAFVSSVTARTPRAEFVEQAPNARRFVIDIQRAEHGYSGSLVVEESHRVATRKVASERCDEIVDAFVLFTAMTLDPGASLSVPETPNVEAPLSESPPPPAAQPSEPPPAPAARATRHVARRDARPVWHLSMGSGAWLATGLGDAPLVAAQPSVELASSRVGLSPAVSLGLVWANGSSQDASPNGAFTVGLRAGSLAGCAYRVRWGDDSRPSLRLCGMFEGGVFAVRPFGFAEPTSPDRPWFAAGPLVRLDVPVLARTLAIRGEAGLAFPFEREHVYAVSGPRVEVVDGVGMRVAVTAFFGIF